MAALLRSQDSFLTRSWANRHGGEGGGGGREAGRERGGIREEGGGRMGEGEDQSCPSSDRTLP